MSKQRPYGTFFEAYILYCITYAKTEFNAMMAYLKAQEEMPFVFSHKIYLPTYLQFNQTIRNLWWGLCVQYGEVNTYHGPVDSAESSYIYSQNLSMCLYDLNNAVEQVSMD